LGGHYRKVYCVVVSTGAGVWASAVCAGVCWLEACVEENGQALAGMLAAAMRPQLKRSPITVERITILL
jgi:hypothetical protein